MKTKRQINFAKLDEEHPEVARYIRWQKFLKEFNKEWKEVIEDDIYIASSNIQRFSERGDIYGHLSFI